MTDKKIDLSKLDPYDGCEGCPCYYGDEFLDECLKGVCEDCPFVPWNREPDPDEITCAFGYSSDEDCGVEWRIAIEYCQFHCPFNRVQRYLEELEILDRAREIEKRGVSRL